MAITPPVPIDAGPALPSSSDSEATFDAAFEAFLSWQKNQLQPQTNAVAANVFANATEAATSAATATTKAGEALASANAAAIARAGSESARDLSQAYAAAAGAAAGLPALAGKARKSLLVRSDESGVEWANPYLKTVNGQDLNGSGDIPISTWATGDLLTTANTLSAPDWLQAGGVYLQSSYAELYAKLGLVSNGFSATNGALPASGQWTGVTYGNGVYVAVRWGVTGAFATSPDGITWTARNAPSDQQWEGIAYGNGLFVAISGGSGLSTVSATSPDGVTWTQRTVPSSYWGSICFGGGKFVAIPYVSTGTVAMTSTDGITWTTTAVPSASANREAVTYGNGLYVLVGGNGSYQVCATSPDGVNWTARTLPASGGWRGVAYGAGLFVASVFAGGNFATSPDGINWTLRSAPGAYNWGEVAFGIGGFLVCSTASDGYAYSPDGITWKLTSITGSGGSCMAYANGFFVSVLTAGSTARRLIPYTYDPASQFFVPSSSAVSVPYKQYVKA